MNAKRIAVIVFLLAVLSLSTYLLAANPLTVQYFPPYDGAENEEGGNEYDDPYQKVDITLSFSQEGHFYTRSIFVEITASNEAARVFFTLDGSAPTEESHEHSEPIVIEATENLQIVVIRAIAVYEDYLGYIHKTRPQTHTYFVGTGVHERFGEDVLIFSLVTDPYYLFDHNYGILVPGALREDFIRDNPGRNIIPTDPANFNLRGREGERPIHVETFTTSGERVVAQDAGLRVFGSWSRAHEQKSLRLIPRREYSPGIGRFHYQFFPGDYILNDVKTPQHRYETLILRNGSNDRYFGMLRNEVGSVLARNAGFYDVTPVRAAAVFVNGEYYGFAWLQVRVDDDFFEKLYEAPSRDFDVIGRGEWWFRNACERVIEDLTYKNMFAWRDLNDEDEFAALNAIVDVENLLRYYAFHIYVGTRDWPYNNLRRWRFTGEQVPDLHPSLDGRWRYAMFDLDWILGLYGDNYRLPTFRYILEDNNDNGQLLRNILTRQDMIDLFTMMLCDIAANVVTEETVRDAIANLYGQAYGEIGHAIDANKFPEWFTRYFAEQNHEEMIHFAANRDGVIFSSLARFFDFDNEMFSIYVLDSDGQPATQARIGTQIASSSRYFNHLTVPVTPILPRFTGFDHWLIDGERFYSETVFVSSANAGTDGVVELTLVTRQDFPPLVIAEAFEEPRRNGLTLVNHNNFTIHTEGLFLSNRRDDLQRWRIPSMSIPSGVRLELAGRGSRSAEDLFRIQMGFNVRVGGTFYLSDIHGNILDHFTLEE
ncbi:MAG: CotH kinase family protein [Oscillospiraceae bacterium]|nr:CotH kinase family protein [Oscillospiraceae bacterium]